MTMTISKRYYLCDQSLMPYSGHCYAYFEPRMRVLKNRGKEVTIVGHNTLLDRYVRAQNVVPNFSYRCDECN